MATIWVDGKEYEVDGSKNLLDVCLSLGLDLPYFCWHPAMGSVGACRQCAVKQYRGEEDTKGQLVMACMAPAADGTRISLTDEEAVEFRESVIEWLMVNHPHDCPICDEGGECHLQDMTVMTGHTYRRYRFKKRTHLNQYLGPFINHEMNRCIQCYRCVRFYRDVADGRDFDVFGAHDNVYFGRHEDGVLENEFSGNLVEVCPTGVFTDKTLKQHYTRKWDLQTAPSVCTLCSVGCNTIPGERYGGLRRIRNRYNREVNGYFLCDRGRYGYEYVNSEQRIRRIRVRSGAEGQMDGEAQQATLDALQEQLRGALRENSVLGIGSPRASLEANFALRALVGEERFSSGVAAQEWELLRAALDMLRNGPARTPSLHEIEQADAILILGEDLTNTAPMMAFAVRQAARSKPHREAAEIGIPLWNDYAIREVVQDRKGPVFLATVASTKLEDIAAGTIHAAPDEIARLGFAVAHALDVDAPQVDGLDEASQEFVGQIAQALREAERPAIISGSGSGSPAVMKAAANVAWALQKQGAPATLSLALPENNSMGAALLGGQPLEVARRMLESGEADTLVILENDLYRRAEKAIVDALFAAAARVFVVDMLKSPTTEMADVVLPAATFAEGDGTFVNQEGRAQRYLQVFVPDAGDAPGAGIKESWRWIADMMAMAGRPEGDAWQTLDDVLQSMGQAAPFLAPVADITPPAGFRIVGQKVPRQPHRYSGRTAMRANIAVSEPKPPEDEDAPMNFSMEGFKGAPPPSLLPRYWSPGWNSVQALNKFQAEVGGPLKGGDPGTRLIEPAEAGGHVYFDDVPEAFGARHDAFLVAPLWHIFGSDRLSMLTPGVAERAPEPYVALNEQDAARLEMTEGQSLSLLIGNITFTLPLRVVPSLPAGVAGLPAGLPGIPYSSLPAWAQFSTGGQA